MTEHLRNEIVRRWRTGTSQRVIARSLGISRGAVRRALAKHEQARTGRQPPSPSRASMLDAYETLIRELLGRYPDLTVTRLLEELRSRGFTGGYTIVRQKLRELRPRVARPPVVRFETAPGAQAQMDYSSYELEFAEEGRRRVNLFSYLLSYSRRQYLRFVESQDFATTVQQHVRAFEHLGGVAANCLYDNMKVVVSGHDGEIPIYNPRFLAFATHYGFRPVACRPRRPQTKGKVERQFWYVETNLLNGRTFRSLEHLNEVTVGWLRDTADARIHRQTEQSPRARHAAEVPHLIPLPAAHYEVAPVVYRTVSVEGVHRLWQQNEYSVPWRYLGQVAASANYGRRGDCVQLPTGGSGPTSAVLESAGLSGQRAAELGASSAGERRTAASDAAQRALPGTGAGGGAVPGVGCSAPSVTTATRPSRVLGLLGRRTRGPTFWPPWNGRYVTALRLCRVVGGAAFWRKLKPSPKGCGL